MHHCVISILLAVSCICLSSCTSVNQVSKETVRNGFTRIVSATLKSGETVMFDHLGGKVRKRGRALVALAKDGQMVLVPIDDIVEMRKHVGPAWNVEKLGSQRIAELILMEGSRLVTIDSIGGIFDAQEHSVKGRSERGEEIHVVPGEIIEIRTVRAVRVTDPNDGEITEVVIAPSSHVIRFASPARLYDAGEYIEGTAVKGKAVILNLDDISGVGVRVDNPERTIPLILGTLAGLVGFFLLFIALNMGPH